ncbi:MAG: hypothetical protein BWX66_01712 [Deltaproteobacteria bacterium ADurb.Bin058]|nr:MAG: hypothetical protein BWX66_01712 [Deltaproteobacteria bacterium ADurb.Bin058]
MNGTSVSQTFAIERRPPRTTTAVRIVITMPETQVGTPMLSLAIDVMALAWTMLPIPKAAKAVNSANIMARGLHLRPRSRTYMGPPAMVPSAFVVRYLTDKRASAYLVEIPKTPVSHIHKTAPGPPAATAVATPTMLPVPIVAAKAVVRAANGLTSPLPPSSRVTDSLMALPMKR